jgi:hypothetical protein
LSFAVALSFADAFDVPFVFDADVADFDDVDDASDVSEVLSGSDWDLLTTSPRRTTRSCRFARRGLA